MTITGRVHGCRADHCNTEVPISTPMCRKHWYMVPKDLRDQVWAAYRRGLGKEYDTLMAVAIESVARLERAKDATP